MNVMVAICKKCKFLFSDKPITIYDLNIIRTNIIHDRFLIIDDDNYSIGSSIKDVGKKRFVMTKIITISKDEFLKNI